MAIKLERIGHCALRVTDVERSKNFYTQVLGFQVMEEDPDHGGVFMSLPGDGHTIDIIPVGEPKSAPSAAENRGRVGLVHIAFKVSSYEALRDAYQALQSHRVEVQRLMDHVSQRSIYFDDPDGNGLEIYYEYPNAREMFLHGRGDEDLPFSFDDPLPDLAAVPAQQHSA